MGFLNFVFIGKSFSAYLLTAGTVNQLNFAAVKFRGLPISFYFANFNFAFCYSAIYYPIVLDFANLPKSQHSRNQIAREI